MMIFKRKKSQNEKLPKHPHYRTDSISGDVSGYPVTKDFLRVMKKHRFDGAGESVGSLIMSMFSRYDDKILGIRNYEADKDECAAIDFVNLDTLYDFIWEVSTGESDFTPAGVTFLNEYFDFTFLANEYRVNNKELPPYGEGKTEKRRIELFVDYMDSIEPMEVALFIAESQWSESNKKGVKPSLENLDNKLLPPK